jgi:hypothetical protein
MADFIYNRLVSLYLQEMKDMLNMKPGGPTPEWAEFPAFGIWPCDNAWHKSVARPGTKCPDCPNEWWAVDGTECQEEYALIAEIVWLRSFIAKPEPRPLSAWDRIKGLMA